jgi:hypothetical protein
LPPVAGVGFLFDEVSVMNTDDNIERLLRAELESAVSNYDRACAELLQAEIRTAGSPRKAECLSASKVRNAARRAVWVAVRRLMNYLVHGTIPEELIIRSAGIAEKGNAAG